MRPIVLLGLISALGTGALAQSPRPVVRNGIDAMNCRACHTAATPTKSNPALSACPRLDEAPPSITLGKAGGKYAPVSFAHRAHAHMAETGMGCNGCHHYDQARAIQPCRNCHAVSRKREDLGKPDLQAAMHRQCIECHRSWDPAGSCATCHVKDAAGTASQQKKGPALIAPERVVYETGSKEGKTVTFFHKDHTGRFARACADCHQQESCATCHDRTRPGFGQAVITRQTAKGLTEDQAHARCVQCHSTDACATCHKGMASRTLSFDHGRRTGFALNRFHAALECKQCHKAPGAYAKLPADCESCHKGWQAKFDHARTGLVLDDQHTGASCTDCHADKSFRATPVCVGCHTDKAWPAQKPGKAVAPARPRK
jgi:hypothetical protein